MTNKSNNLFQHLPLKSEWLDLFIGMEAYTLNATIKPNGIEQKMTDGLILFGDTQMSIVVRDFYKD
jgi:hypothetical protein